MIAERPVDTVDRFIRQGWTLNEVDKNRLVAELLSVSNETNRRPDASCFSIANGLLIDPETKRPVLDFIAPGVERNIALDLQTWAQATEEGIAWWISPRLAGLYPCNKVIIYQIGYDANLQKSLLYSAILFDGEIKNAEAYRKTLFTAEDTDENLFSILAWIEKVSGQKQKDLFSSTLGRSQAEYYADQIRLGVDSWLIVQQMQQSGFLGKNPISCPLGAESFSDFTIRGGNILVFSPKREILKCVTCPFCKNVVDAIVVNGKICCPPKPEGCGESVELRIKLTA